VLERPASRKARYRDGQRRGVAVMKSRRCAVVALGSC
jgi:hypothetical protein